MKPLQRQETTGLHLSDDGNIPLVRGTSSTMGIDDEIPSLRKTFSRGHLETRWNQMKATLPTMTAYHWYIVRPEPTINHDGATDKVLELGKLCLKLTVILLVDHNISKIGRNVLQHDDKLLSQNCMDHWDWTNFRVGRHWNYAKQKHWHQRHNYILSTGETQKCDETATRNGCEGAYASQYFSAPSDSTDDSHEET